MISCQSEGLKLFLAEAKEGKRTNHVDLSGCVWADLTHVIWKETAANKKTQHSSGSRAWAWRLNPEPPHHTCFPIFALQMDIFAFFCLVSNSESPHLNSRGKIPVRTWSGPHSKSCGAFIEASTENTSVQLKRFSYRPPVSVLTIFAPFSTSEPGDGNESCQFAPGLA